MVIEKSYSESNIIPEDLKVGKLGGNLYELESNVNITTVEKDEGTFYLCDKTLMQVNINNKDDGIVALIRLRYTLDDEFTLINKGIADSTNVEYQTYRSYVSTCKTNALIYFNY